MWHSQNKPFISDLACFYVAKIKIDCERFSRGGGKSYERGVGYQNSSGSSHNYDGGPPVGSHREYSRSMSTDNWREAKSAGLPPPEEERDIPRNSGTQVRGILNLERLIGEKVWCYGLPGSARVQRFQVNFVCSIITSVGKKSLRSLFQDIRK